MPFNENDYIAEEWRPYIERHQSVAGIKLYIVEMARELHRLTHTTHGPIYTHISPAQQDRIDQLRHLILVANVDMRKEISSLDRQQRQEIKNDETERVANLLRQEEATLRKENLKLTRSATGAAILSAVVAIFSFAKNLSDDGRLEKRTNYIEQSQIESANKHADFKSKLDILENKFLELNKNKLQKNSKPTSSNNQSSIPTSKKNDK